MENMEKTTEAVQESDGKNERLFTQEEVNQIIKKRLERRKEEVAETADQIQQRVDKAIAERNADLDRRASRLDCQEYIVESGYPKELLDSIDTSDVEAFKQKADMMVRVFESRQARQIAPIGSFEPIMTGSKGPIASAFAPDQKHTPKPYPPRFDE